MILIKLQVFAVQDFLLTSNFRFENIVQNKSNE